MPRDLFCGKVELKFYCDLLSFTILIEPCEKNRCHFFKCNIMSMVVKIHSKYNYQTRRCGAFLDLVAVDVVDTSVDNVKNNVSVNSSAPAQSFYTNSDVPVSLFGLGITSTHYDPNRHRGAFAPQDASAPAAAAAPSSSTSSNAAQNAAAAAVPSSNSATISNS